jgi:hypothetical protein
MAEKASINHPHLFPFPLSISFFALDYFGEGVGGGGEGFN